MSHWAPPEIRGIYNHPGTQPPPPQPHEGNNVLSRLVRIETYLQHALSDRIRAEQEGIQRDHDLRHRLGLVESTLAEWTSRTRATIMAVNMILAVGRYVAAVCLLALWFNGAISWASIKGILGALGFPAP